MDDFLPAGNVADPFETEGSQMVEHRKSGDLFTVTTRDTGEIYMEDRQNRDTFKIDKEGLRKFYEPLE